MRRGKYTRTETTRNLQSERAKLRPRRPIEERFWSKVAKAGPDECWPWTGARERSGYGKLSGPRRGIFLKAHRVAWEIANGTPIPAGQYVLHSCDNPPCVNPAHLRIGVHAENMEDRAERRRGREHRQRGEANDNAKLTEEQVRAIIAELQRLPRRSQASIASQFGIKQPQVSRIMRRINWAHLWDE